MADKTVTKVEYRKALEDCIYLCGCAVRGLLPDKCRVSKMNIVLLYRASYIHLLTGAVAYALESAGIYDRAFTQAKAKAMRKLGLMDAEMSALFERMEQEGIWYMPLKGVVLKDYYPSYGMRQMADHDILFDETKADKVKEILVGMGFAAEHFGTGNHDCYYKKPVCNFEMHRSLFGKGHDDKMQKYYANIKSRLIKDDGNEYGYHFSPEDFYVYMIAHEHKHYSISGTGIRSLLDTYVYLKKETLDMDYVTAETEKLGIGDFEKLNRSLSLHLFEGEKLTDEEEEMLGFVFSSGTYGTCTNRVRNTIRKNGWSKARYMIYRISVPVSRKNKDYEAYAAAYPVFYRYKVLLVILPFYRTFRSMREKRFSVEAKAIRDA